MASMKDFDAEHLQDWKLPELDRSLLPMLQKRGLRNNEVARVFIITRFRHYVEDDIKRLGLNSRDRRICWITGRGDMHLTHGHRHCVAYWDSRPQGIHDDEIRGMLAARDIYIVSNNLAQAMGCLDWSYSIF